MFAAVLGVVLVVPALNAIAEPPPVTKLAWYWRLVPGWLRPGAEYPNPRIIEGPTAIDLSRPG